MSSAAALPCVLSKDTAAQQKTLTFADLVDRRVGLLDGQEPRSLSPGRGCGEEREEKKPGKISSGRTYIIWWYTTYLESTHSPHTQRARGCIIADD